MLHIILYRPEIPANTGNIIRLCANSGAGLHLIRPLGFTLDDKRLRRAGLDYHEYARLKTHDELADCLSTLGQPRVFAFTKFATRGYADVRYRDGDALLFGQETRGLSAAPLAALECLQRVRIPMYPNSRCLNLSNSVAVAVYEAWRQLDFAGAGPAPAVT